MSFWNRLFAGDVFNKNDTLAPPIVNPSTGLTMIDGYGGIDVGGSPFGQDIHQPPYVPQPPSVTEW